MQQSSRTAAPVPDRWSFVVGSSAPIIMGTDEAAKQRCDAEPKNLWGKAYLSQPCHRSAGPVCAAHAEFAAVMTKHPPRPIPIEADALDLEDRAAHLSKVFGALSAYLAVILDDTAQNVPGRLDLPDVEAHLADLAADVAGLIERAAEDMRGWIA